MYTIYGHDQKNIHVLEGKVSNFINIHRNILAKVTWQARELMMQTTITIHDRRH